MYRVNQQQNMYLLPVEVVICTPQTLPYLIILTNTSLQEVLVMEA